MGARSAIAIRMVVLALVAALHAGPVTADSPVAGLAAARGEIARNLAEPIAACVERHDTSHPVFHGCIDWHSSVHGHWALTALARVTGNRALLESVTARLDPAMIAREQRDLAARPRFEMPYGRAWFLRLAMEYERATGDRRLRPMADDIAASLVGYLDGDSFQPMLGSYGSQTWALLNLRAWGLFADDETMIRFVRAKVAEQTAGAPLPCPFDADARAGSFMAICTNWAWLAGETADSESAPAVVRSLLPPETDMAPLESPGRSHLYGLDFSRAWGLWRLWRITDDAAYLAAYAAHFRRGYEDRSWWDGEYRAVGHWVAQFGVFALMPLFEADYR